MSKMEEVVPKMARRRGSDAGQSRRRVRSSRGCPVLSRIGKRTRESCDRGSEVWTVHSGRDGMCQFLPSKPKVSRRKILSPRTVAGVPMFADRRQRAGNIAPVLASEADIDYQEVQCDRGPTGSLELHGRRGGQKGPKYPRRTLVGETLGPWRGGLGPIDSQ